MLSSVVDWKVANHCYAMVSFRTQWIRMQYSVEWLWHRIPIHRRITILFFGVVWSPDRQSITEIGDEWPFPVHRYTFIGRRRIWFSCGCYQIIIRPIMSCAEISIAIPYSIHWIRIDLKCFVALDTLLELLYLVPFHFPYTIPPPADKTMAKPPPTCSVCAEYKWLVSCALLMDQDTICYEVTLVPGIWTQDKLMLMMKIEGTLLLC